MVPSIANVGELFTVNIVLWFHVVGELSKNVYLLYLLLYYLCNKLNSNLAPPCVLVVYIYIFN